MEETEHYDLLPPLLPTHRTQSTERWDTADTGAGNGTDADHTAYTAQDTYLDTGHL